MDDSRHPKTTQCRVQVHMTKFTWGDGYAGHKPFTDSPMR